MCGGLDENFIVHIGKVVTGLVRPRVLVETWDDGRLISNAFAADDASYTKENGEQSVAYDGGPEVSRTQH